MKIYKFCQFLLFILILHVGFNSCTKDAARDLHLDDRLRLQSRSSNLSVINGMLSFDNYSDFVDFYTDIEARSSDTSEIIDAFTFLNVDLSQELLPNLTFYPVALVEEMGIAGFSSARKLEEDFLNNALNNGDETVLYHIAEPYLKSALNQDYSVHIGTRIFKFFEHDGIVLVLNNDWTLYNAIKHQGFEQISDHINLLVISRDFSLWSDIYELDVNGRPTNEKIFVKPEIEISESPRACDFSNSIRITDLGDGRIRLSLIHTRPNEFYEWTLPDGTIIHGNPLFIDCNQVGGGWVQLDAYVDCPPCPSGRIRKCTGRIEIICRCPARRSKRERYQNLNAAGRTLRIEASLWVRPNQVGCESRLFARGAFGIWFPMNWVHNTNGVCVDIEGVIKREVNNQCIDVTVPFTQNCLPSGSSNAGIDLTIPQAGNTFRNPDKLSSAHRVKFHDSPWFGFGADVPRLVLD
jgi:hypothetical protein